MMKKLVRIVAAACCLFGLTFPLERKADASATGTIIGTEVRMRKGAGTNTEIIGYFDDGEKVEVLKSNVNERPQMVLSLSVGFGDIWFANLYSVTGDKKQKCVSNIKIPTCDFDELSWLKQYLEKRMDMLLLELKNEVSSVSFEPKDIAGLPISSDDKIKLLDMLHGLWFDVYKVFQEK